MNLSLFGKLGIIFKYIFSSFLSIELFIFCLLLFFILLLSIRKNNIIIQIIAIAIYVGFILGIIVTYGGYAQASIDTLIKMIMNYIYFPSTVFYFFIIVFVTVMILWTLFCNKLTKFKKIFNYAFFSSLYFFFMCFISLSAYDGVDLLDITNLYQNDVILAFVQISNLILFIWIVYTVIYWFYKYLKKKYD